MNILSFNKERYAPMKAKSLHGCRGFYRRSKNGMRLYDEHRNLQAFLCANVRQGFFAVTAHLTSDGKEHFMFSTCQHTEKWLGLEGLSMSAEEDLIKAMEITNG